MQKRIKIELCGNDLAEQVIAEMWSVYQPFYHYSETSFRERIDRNTHYALYRQNGRIVGFTGLRIQKIDLANEKFLTVYFGQTVVTNQVRGCGLINRTGLLIIAKFWSSFLSRKVVFWADALTYRAYLVFAKNLQECYPRRDQLLPLNMRKLRDHLGYTNYGDRYCPMTGTVAKDHFLVNDPQMIIAEEKLRDPDVYLFAQANPNYLQGSGLLTMGPSTWSNLAFMVKKALGKQQQMKSKVAQPISLQPEYTH
jgi:hypothetical protein